MSDIQNYVGLAWAFLLTAILFVSMGLLKHSEVVVGMGYGLVLAIVMMGWIAYVTLKAT